MNDIRTLKTALKDALSLESELVDLVKECFESIFDKEDFSAAWGMFQHNLNNMYDMGCIQSMASIRHNLEANKKRAAEYLAQRAAEQATKGDSHE